MIYNNIEFRFDKESWFLILYILCFYVNNSFINNRKNVNDIIRCIGIFFNYNQTDFNKLNKSHIYSYNTYIQKTLTVRKVARAEAYTVAIRIRVMIANRLESTINTV